MSSVLSDQYRRWYQYEKDVHRQVLDSLASVPEEGRGSAPYQKALDLMGHIVAARRMWLHRIDPANERPPAVFPNGTTLDGLRADLDAIEQKWTDYLTRLTEPELSRMLEFKTMDGLEFRSVIVDVLTQLSAHSNYHRGQIATLVRASGGEPAKTDFIFWCRQQN